MQLHPTSDMRSIGSWIATMLASVAVMYSSSPLNAQATPTRVERVRAAIAHHDEELAAEFARNTRLGLPTSGANSIEIAMAYNFCIVTLAAQGHGFNSEVGIGIEFECTGSSVYSSDWRQHIRDSLADAGIARAFSTFPGAAWSTCTDRMIAAPPARIRRGEAFTAYCLPAAIRVARQSERSRSSRPTDR